MAVQIALKCLQVKLQLAPVQNAYSLIMPYDRCTSGLFVVEQSIQSRFCLTKALAVLAAGKLAETKIVDNPLGKVDFRPTPDK